MANKINENSETPKLHHKIKLREPELRKEAYRQYCEHIASGYPQAAFHFDYESISLDFRTIERYMEKFPDELPAVDMQRAMATRFRHWFDEGKTIMKGGYKYSSPLIWQTIMRNIFKNEGWDKDVMTTVNKSHIERLAEAIRSGSITEAEEGHSDEQQGH